MIKKMIIITFLVFFTVGTVLAATADKNTAKPAVHRNNITQMLYNWFGGLDRLCVSQYYRSCKACDKECCAACNIDCGGTCCANCTAKPKK